MARVLYRIHTDKGSTIIVPLHHCLMYSPPYETVKALIDAYPAGLALCDSLHKQYPLHIACSEAPNNFPVIEVLLSAFPDIAMVKDKSGRLPLHYAIEKKASPKIILLLLEYQPWSAAQPDNDGCYPLHMACSLELSLEIIQKLAESWPLAVLKDVDGRSPYDIVANGNATDKKMIIEMLREDEELSRMFYPCNPNTMLVNTANSAGRIAI